MAKQMKALTIYHDPNSQKFVEGQARPVKLMSLVKNRPDLQTWLVEFPHGMAIRTFKKVRLEQ